MITDDDKKAAEEFLKTYQVPMPYLVAGDYEDQVGYLGFLAGIEHARKQHAIKEHGPDPKYRPVTTPLPAGWYGKPHVVADGELPEECHRVVAVTDSEDYYILRLQFMDGSKYWFGQTFETYMMPIDKVKYWWPLPEFEGEK